MSFFKNRYVNGDQLMAKKKVTKEIKKAASTSATKMNSFYAWDGDTLILNILGTPAAKRDAIGKVKGSQLKISVSEVPNAGKATDHLVQFLAKEFGVSKNDIEVVFGRLAVNKQLRIKNPKKLPAEISRD
ncbi:DUF167 domain-containing protein [Segetibacter koreensis]|uniref:DUF167 domain-containing protein n=1 Tax=Segetibacter koreensis TaxID=398037 RepID=UPI000361A801|nr:DUF167 family protein [Segetibacter koreensis]